ncbi:DnaJ domain [Trypanosoma vivax]|uniref:Putative TPR-repeat-containing chaperone protein DNAJ n=1 Tax=Trypanosoma vivax (strain Y486) TaxID=1055687 RepID=G0TYH2_TRYVY|nr:putative TPR-repeat-containing chaperone protein DNAJ [Trypanosoma vivax]KAH8611547.1 DnaJ domain [Trypanosoma vivax]CCC49019.1 putative TPR-repeat-containing chaperone protein DNAJ [Trypanosoma vivax Y486]
MCYGYQVASCVQLFLSVALASAVLFWPTGNCNATPDDEVAKNLLQAGDASLRQGRSHYQEALAKYSAALAHNPKSIRALYSRAELLSMLRRREDSLNDLKRLLELDDKHLRGLTLRASLYSQTGHLQEAVVDLEQLIPLLNEAGRTAKAQEYTVMLEKMQGYAKQWLPLQQKLVDAKNRKDYSTIPLEELRTCVAVLHGMIREFAKDNVGLRLQRAECALECNDNQAAAEELKYAVQKEPQNLEAVALGARAFRMLGGIEQARRELRRCLSLDPEYFPCAQLHKLVREQIRVTTGVGKALEDNDFKTALRLIDGVSRVEKNPPYKDQLMRWRCIIAVGMRDVEKGFTICDEAAQLYSEQDPSVVDILLQKFELHLLDDNVGGAEEELKRVQELQPNDSRMREYKHRLEKAKRAAARKNYYKILGVKKTADATEIRRAYRHLAKTLHPDKLVGQNLSPKERQKAEERFRDINEAKEILLDNEKRSRYDAGEDPTKPPGQGGGDPFNFNEFFGHGGANQFFFRFE